MFRAHVLITRRSKLHYTAYTETSELSKITKIQFYKYEQIVVKFTHKFYYYLLIFIELYFSNFRPLTCFSVMILEAV